MRLDPASLLSVQSHSFISLPLAPAQLEQGVRDGNASRKALHTGGRDGMNGGGDARAGVSHNIRIVQVAQSLEISGTTTILQAAVAAGIAYPYGCQSGNCGACKSHLLSGIVSLEGYSEFALSEDERRAGMILACRAIPASDCEVAWLEEDDLITHPRRALRCRVSELIELTHDIRCVRLTIEAGGPFVFSAGQFASVTFAGLPPRDYSMANRPGAELLEFHVRRMPGGVSSQFVTSSLQVGAEVAVSGPYGTSYLRQSHRGPIIAIAGGSGLAPVKSIVEQALELRLPQPIHLYFGAREERDLYLLEHFQALAQSHANLNFTAVLSEPACHTTRRTGLVHRIVAEDLADFDGCKAYIAGPPPMVEAATAMLAECGMRRIDIHADAFYTAAEMAAAGRRTGDQM